MSMQSYRIEIRWTHRNWGPQRAEQKAEASSIRRAIAHALLSFFSNSAQRKNTRDAHTQLDVRAWRIKKEKTK